MNSYTLVFFDTETTGNTINDRICQLSYLYHQDHQKIVFNELFKPPIDISFEAMSVHHITNKHVAHCPSFTEAPTYNETKQLFEGSNTCVIAHNAKFDIDMVAKENIFPTRHIDTLKIIRWLDPDVESGRHSLQYLRYYLDLDSELTETVMAHDAFGDVLVLELLFKRLLKDTIQKHSLNETDAIEKMIQISNEPMYIGKLSFGKHMGKTLTELAQTDPSYLNWLLNEKVKTQAEKGSEEDWIYSIKKALGKL